MDEHEPKSSMISARLLILLAVAAGLGAAFAVRTSAPPPEVQELTDLSDAPKETIKEISQLDLPGEEPPESPEFDVQFDIDTSTIKNRVILYITEAHGYYVESIAVRFWWKGDDPDLERDDSIYSFDYRINNYIKANETFKDCFDLSAPEVQAVGGDVGNVESWGVRLESYRRAREQNPDTFPPVSPVGRECSG